MLIDDIRAVYLSLSLDAKVAIDRDTDDALKRLAHVVHAYDALRPDWNDAPDWAKWYAVDASGSVAWFIVKPYCDDSEGACWCPQPADDDGRIIYGKWADTKMTMPPGIDWRLCCWARPEQEARDDA